ncbi:MAG: hypothetical protein HYZ42_09050, partial [Bacteroidetes bacterium]|nr:hypothetical protein [Bacteroidota bacterium]
KIKTRVDQRTQVISAKRKKLMPRVAASIAACLVLGVAFFAINNFSMLNQLNMASINFSSIFGTTSSETEIVKPHVVKHLFPISTEQKKVISQAVTAASSDTTWSVLITNFNSISDARVCIDDLAAQNITAKFSIRENNKTWVSIVKTGDKSAAIQCVGLLQPQYNSARILGKKN